MEYFAVVVWQGDIAVLDPPAIVCRVWHPEEGPDVGVELDAEELEAEVALHERGHWYCECFSRVAPGGEFGYRSDRFLHPISQSDFERAVELLREQDLSGYEDYVCDSVVRAAVRFARAERDQSPMSRPVILRVLS